MATKKKIVTEEAKETSSESKYKFIENENGQHPSEGQVSLYGLDITKKYILTKNKS